MTGVLDPGSHIGGVALRMADLETATRFYEEAIGLEVIAGEPLMLGAGGRALVTLLDGAQAPPPPRSTGLFHLAILHPTREALGAALVRLIRAGASLTGASDHGVSEALYLDDPELNGIELYWDRPREVWPLEPNGNVAMFTAPLDVEALLHAAQSDDAIDPRTVLGHVHLKVADIERSVRFYRDALGMSLRQRFGAEAAFLAAGDYHHHVGANTWQSRGGEAPPPGSAGLDSFTVALPSRAALEEAVRRLGSADLQDPDGIQLRLVETQ